MQQPYNHFKDTHRDHPRKSDGPCSLCPHDVVRSCDICLWLALQGLPEATADELRASAVALGLLPASGGAAGAADPTAARHARSLPALPPLDLDALDFQHAAEGLGMGVSSSGGIGVDGDGGWAAGVAASAMARKRWRSDADAALGVTSGLTVWWVCN